MRIGLLVLFLLIYALPLHAVSLGGVGSFESLSGFWERNRLTGSQTDSLAPPSNLSEIEKAEWYIGMIVASGELCGYHGKASQVRSFMKDSPHFQNALSQMNRFRFAKGCGLYGGYLDDIIDEKSSWQARITKTYGNP